jgi:GNAT superfamily N-acetyltransferase
MDPALAALLDELAANAIAASTVQRVDGWVLRAAPRLPFRRANSAFPLRPDGDVDAILAVVEEFYASRDLPARVQCSGAAPAGLDTELANRGYTVEAPVDVLVVARDELAVPTVPDVTVDVATELTPATIDALAPGDARLVAYSELLPTVGPPAFVATARVDAHVAGVGLAVVERGWVGVFGMRTRTDDRRRGVASAVLGALAALAPRCYLQVETDNAAARALYARAGFRHAYGYHYRTRSPV